MPDPADPSATLEAIRDRAGVVAKLGPPRPETHDAVAVAAFESAADVPWLLKALEAVLELADDWAREGEGPIWRLPDEDAAAKMAGSEHAAALRKAIARALRGDTDG